MLFSCLPPNRAKACDNGEYHRLGAATFQEANTQIQLNTDSHIEGREGLARHIEGEVSEAFGEVGAEITRVEVHLSDERPQGGGGALKRCVIEARLAGRQPIAVSHEAGTVHEAFDGAKRKMQRLLHSTLGRLQSNKGGDTIRRDDAP
mgnify:CR=1 FL=1